MLIDILYSLNLSIEKTHTNEVFWSFRTQEYTQNPTSSGWLQSLLLVSCHSKYTHWPPSTFACKCDVHCIFDDCISLGSQKTPRVPFKVKLGYHVLNGGTCVVGFVLGSSSPMVGKSSDVQIQIQIQPNLQIQIQIRSFKKA